MNGELFRMVTKALNSKMALFFIWFALAITITLILGSINWPRYYRLLKRGVTTQGSVTKKEPKNHQNVHYSYFVGQSILNGIGSGGFGNPSFEELKIGDEVKVFYLPSNPQTSCLGNPKELLENETIPIVLAALFSPSFIILVNSKKIKKKWLKMVRKFIEC